MRSKTIRLLAVSLFCGFLSWPATAAERPNVVLIYADDLGYGDLGCYGATKVKTPHLDRMAREGRLFTDAHAASAVCTPSRYALLTGDYPFRQGKNGTWGPLPHTSPLIIDPARLTLGRLFNEAGYATACIGKWHLGFGKGRCDWNKPLRPGPLELGFDYFYGIPKVNSGPPYVYVENDRIVGWDPDDPMIEGGKPPSPTPSFPEKRPNIFGGAKKAHTLYDDEQIATRLTEKAVSWIKENQEHPFFLYFPTPNIHHPFTPHPRFKGTSEAGRYGDFIHELDWMVGELLRTLDDLKLTKNTLVLFTSDNGGMYNGGGQDAWKAGHRMNGDLLGFKFGAWEGGHRIPFIARWPGHIEVNSRSDELISSIDLLATFASLLDRKLSPTDAVDSVNIIEAFMSEPKAPLRDHLLVASRDNKILMLRSGKWVFINGRGDGGQSLGARGGPKAVASSGGLNSDLTSNGTFRKDAPLQQLYDLEKDLSQARNVIADHPEISAKLARRLKEIRKSTSTRP